jgi:hypothetical protein
MWTEYVRDKCSRVFRESTGLNLPEFTGSEAMQRKLIKHEVVQATGRTIRWTLHFPGDCEAATLRHLLTECMTTLTGSVGVCTKHEAQVGRLAASLR